MRARTTRESEGLLCPPLLVPVEGRDGKSARSITEPMRAQTARAENALVIPLRNNGVAKPVDSNPWLTFAAGGTHQALLYGYDTGKLRPADTVPLPAQTTIEGDAVLRAGTASINAAPIDVDACTFRMLTVDEIRAGMAFTPGYTLLGTAKRAKVRMLGNAVTPPAARDLMACVVEAITGTTFDLAA
jgi:DNA (cytosine-5)-methyltransferase 1